MLSTLSILSTLIIPVSAQEASGELVVFAAASLTNAYQEIADRFEQTHPGVQVLLNFAGSSDLSLQIQQGAPADVFASANLNQMCAAQDALAGEGEFAVFARNRLIVILPSDNPGGVNTLADLAQPGLALVLAVPGVPVRDYSDTMLNALAADVEYGEAYRAAVLENLVSEEPNVRQVVTRVALGEADAGIVYASDVTPDLAAQLLILDVPDVFNVIAEYPVATVLDAEQPELAQAFVALVLSVEGQAILSRWGFIGAGSAPEPVVSFLFARLERQSGQAESITCPPR
jgi:molybdate transport system substrate-binding protein